MECCVDETCVEVVLTCFGGIRRTLGLLSRFLCLSAGCVCYFQCSMRSRWCSLSIVVCSLIVLCTSVALCVYAIKRHCVLAPCILSVLLCSFYDAFDNCLCGFCFIMCGALILVLSCRRCAVTYCQLTSVALCVCVCVCTVKHCVHDTMYLVCFNTACVVFRAVRVSSCTCLYFGLVVSLVRVYWGCLLLLGVVWGGGVYSCW